MPVAMFPVLLRSWLSRRARFGRALTRGAVRVSRPTAPVAPLKLPPWHGHLGAGWIGGSQFFCLRSGVFVRARWAVAGGPCRRRDLPPGPAVAVPMWGSFGTARVHSNRAAHQQL